jgi:hypothetical protein
MFCGIRTVAFATDNAISAGRVLLRYHGASLQTMNVPWTTRFVGKRLDTTRHHAITHASDAHPCTSVHHGLLAFCKRVGIFHQLRATTQASSIYRSAAANTCAYG